MRRSLLLRRKVRITTVVAEVVIVEGSLGRTVRFVRLSVRRVSAGGARDATGEEGAARAASGEIAGGGAFLSAESQLAKQEVLQEKELQELQAAK